MNNNMSKIVIGFLMLALAPGSFLEQENAAIGFQGNLRERISGGAIFGKGVRIYSAQLRSFLAFDSPVYSPWGLGGLSAQAFVHHNPNNLTDSMGHMVDEFRNEQRGCCNCCGTTTTNVHATETELTATQTEQTIQQPPVTAQPQPSTSSSSPLPEEPPPPYSPYPPTLPPEHAPVHGYTPARDKTAFSTPSDNNKQVSNLPTSSGEKEAINPLPYNPNFTEDDDLLRNLDTHVVTRPDGSFNLKSSYEKKLISHLNRLKYKEKKQLFRDQFYNLITQYKENNNPGVSFHFNSKLNPHKNLHEAPFIEYNSSSDSDF